MKFGIYFDISVRQPCGPDAEMHAFDAALAQAVEAEALGFEYCWAAEHHFLEEYSHSPAPEIFLAAVAGRTTRIRVGASVLATPMTHPAMLAERAAVLDLLSHGRVDLAVSRPIAWAELGGFNANEAQPADVWEETVRAVPQAWMNERVVMGGTHFSTPERAVRPKPYQKPHPPLWSACDEAASLGLGAMSAALADFTALAQRLAAYRTRIATAEPVAGFINEQFAVSDWLYCHEGDGRGVETGARLVRTQRDLAAQLVSAHELGLGGELPRATGLVVGDPKSIIDTLRAWEAMGIDCVNFKLNAADAVSREETIASLKLFALEVMPVFMRQRARAAAE